MKRSRFTEEQFIGILRQAVQPDGRNLEIVTLFYGRGCWNWQTIDVVSVLRACMSYCAGKGWCRTTSGQEVFTRKKTSRCVPANE